MQNLLPILKNLRKEILFLYIDKLVFEYKERNLFIPTLTMDDLKLDD